MSPRKLNDLDILIVDDDEDILSSMELAARSEARTPRLRSTVMTPSPSGERNHRKWSCST